MFRADATDAADETGHRLARAQPHTRVRGAVARGGAQAGGHPGIDRGRRPNARVEAVNNKIKVATGQGYGFRNIDDPMARVTPGCSDLRPALPGRAAVM